MDPSVAGLEENEIDLVFTGLLRLLSSVHQVAGLRRDATEEFADPGKCPMNDL